jgi:uncharacterized protein involved in cysteine biosynthesis
VNVESAGNAVIRFIVRVIPGLIVILALLLIAEIGKLRPIVRFVDTVIDWPIAMLFNESPFAATYAFNDACVDFVVAVFCPTSTA